MRSVLLCSTSDLEEDLGRTLLWREDIARLVAARAEYARTLAVAARPQMAVVDRDLPGAGELIADLRRDPTTRPLSIVVLSRGDFDGVELDLLEAGANAILRLPAGPEWDERLARLIQVPLRREGRFPVHFEVEAEAGSPPTSGLALALNLSVRGMLMQCSLPLGIGDDLDLGFRLLETDPPVTVRGRVVRQTKGERFGLEFHRFVGDGEERVAQFVGALATPLTAI
ncbi:MAG TPA: PilZ domain-containing protein [Vicinamibacteria bacterium]|jgi:DNA-binding response OmpR family regulator|nr:PilZ domain-containing protein [Vicinamibacteria bacterium]